MEERRLQERPNKTRPSGNRPRRLVIHQWRMHHQGVKCVLYQACPCRSSIKAITIGRPSDDCHNKVPTRTPTPRGRLRAPTAPRLMTNMNQNIVEASDFTLILFQVAHQVVFHPDALEFTTSILTDGAGWPALPAYAGAAYADHALTKTVTSDTATSAAINSDKKIQTMHNHQTVQPQQPDYPPTLTVSSRRRPVMERVMATQNMTSCPETHPQARPKFRN